MGEFTFECLLVFVICLVTLFVLVLLVAAVACLVGLDLLFAC